VFPASVILLLQVFKLIWSVEAAVVSLAEIFVLQHCRSSSELIPQQQSKAMAGGGYHSKAAFPQHARVGSRQAL